MSRKSKIDPALKVELVERYWRDAFCDIVYIFCSENDIMMQGKPANKKSSRNLEGESLK